MSENPGDFYFAIFDLIVALVFVVAGFCALYGGGVDNAFFQGMVFFGIARLYVHAAEKS